MRKCILMLALIVLCVSSLLAETEDSVMVVRNGHTSYRGVKVRLGMDINDMVDEIEANDIIMGGQYNEGMRDPYGNSRDGYIVLKDHGPWTREPATENVIFIAYMDKRLESISLFFPDMDYKGYIPYEVLYSAMDVDGLLISSDLSYEDLISLLKSRGIEYQILKGREFQTWTINPDSTRVIFQTDKGYSCFIEYDNSEMTKDDKFYDKPRLIEIFVDK